MSDWDRLLESMEYPMKEEKVIILDKATRKKSPSNYVCDGCGKQISIGRTYIHVRVRVGGKDIRVQHRHIECFPL